MHIKTSIRPRANGDSDWSVEVTHCSLLPIVDSNFELLLHF